MKKKIIILVLMLCCFLICNWLWDIFYNYSRKGLCAENGMINICNTILPYHLCWYISIGLFVALTIMYLIEVKK